MENFPAGLYITQDDDAEYGYSYSVRFEGKIIASGFEDCADADDYAERHADLYGGDGFDYNEPDRDEPEDDLPF